MNLCAEGGVDKMKIWHAPSLPGVTFFLGGGVVVGAVPHYIPWGKCLDMVDGAKS